MGPSAAQKQGKHRDRHRDCSAQTGRTPTCTKLHKCGLIKVRMEAWRVDSLFGAVLPLFQLLSGSFHPGTLTVSIQTLAGVAGYLTSVGLLMEAEEACAAGASGRASDGRSG